MRLRADIGEVDEVLADWWQEFSTGDDAIREDLVDQVRKENLKRPRAVRAPRPASAPHRTPGDAATDGDSAQVQAGAPVQHASDEDGAYAQAGDAPKKRRRRRRSGAVRPAGDGQGQGGPADSN